MVCVRFEWGVARRLRVGDTSRSGAAGAEAAATAAGARGWREGGLMVFDDSFEHEVWHRGKAPRAVLLFNFVPPWIAAANPTAAAVAAPGTSDS